MGVHSQTTLTNAKYPCPRLANCPAIAASRSDSRANAGCAAAFTVRSSSITKKRGTMKHNKSKRKNSATHNRQTKSVVEKTVERDEVNERRDLDGMKRWIKSLSYESLMNALEFTFETDANIPREHGPRRIYSSMDRRCGDSGSHEFDLLIDMSSYQSPDRNGLVFDGVGELEYCHEWRRFGELGKQVCFEPDAQSAR